MQDFRYYAFISYNSKDTAWGRRLQRKLEHYRMPAALCSQRGWKRKPISPVFFAPTDIQPGVLSDELKSRLRASRNLVVICSPNSARSEWVGKEIEYFCELGRANDIYFFIVDGIPNSGDEATECFNPVVRQLGLPEILGVNIHEGVYRLPWLNRQRAYVQLISKLLGVEFDSIWKRHRRRLVARYAAIAAGTIAVGAAMAMIWAANQPFDTRVCLEEVSAHNPALPPLHDAVVAMELDREVITDTIAAEGGCAEFFDIPHRYLGREVHISFSCPDFVDVDTTVVLDREVKLNIRRDAQVYGHIRKRLWNWESETGEANTAVRIDGRDATSDADGFVSLSIPPEEQKEYYLIEIPSRGVTDTVFMPCADGQVIVL